jgi:hypothetical protein
MWFHWAHEDGAHGMPRIRDLEARGYRLVREHPRWPRSWLMVWSVERAYP